MDTALDVVLDSVVKRFGDVAAVAGVSLEIRKGEFVSFIGPSGCGKTTTVRMIAGLEQPTSGAISIQGKRMDNVPAYQRDTAVVWQHFALFPHMSVTENVEFGLRMRGQDKPTRRQKVKHMLEVMGLAGYENRRIHELSGGQRQRVGLARALVTEPSILMLDEPLGALDAQLRISMQTELKELQRRLGITFIHVTHNQYEAMAMADRVVVMNAGRIEQADPPEILFQNPRTRFVAEFVGTNNIFSGTASGVDGRTITVQTTEGSFRAIVPPGHELPTAGGPVDYVVRADAAVGGPLVGPEHDNQVTGILRGEEYAGSNVLLLLELPQGQMFRLEVSTKRVYSVKPALGEPLQVAWKTEDATLLG